MSNRTDYDRLAAMLAKMFGWPPEVQERVESELHNAHVAGLEGSACECRWCDAERLETGNPRPDLAPGEPVPRAR
jgi:hypothetical protein